MQPHCIGYPLVQLVSNVTHDSESNTAFNSNTTFTMHDSETSLTILLQMSAELWLTDRTEYIQL